MGQRHAGHRFGGQWREHHFVQRHQQRDHAADGDDHGGAALSEQRRGLHGRVRSDTPAIGLAASGVNTISFNATNSGTTPLTATITVVPHYLNNGVDCTGAATNVYVAVNPTPVVSVVANEAQTVCNGTAIAPVSFSGVATSYQWVNNTPAIGLAASGVNTISFNATNSGTTPLTATITVVPHYLNNGVDCTGAA